MLFLFIPLPSKFVWINFDCFVGNTSKHVTLILQVWVQGRGKVCVIFLSKSHNSECEWRTGDPGYYSYENMCVFVAHPMRLLSRRKHAMREHEAAWPAILTLKLNFLNWRCEVSRWNSQNKYIPSKGFCLRSHLKYWNPATFNLSLRAVKLFL